MRGLFVFFLFFIFASIPVKAADLLNGRALNKTCALCHGAWGQGTEGALAPRIAGLTKDYLVKALNEYKTGKRKNETMVISSGIDKMTKSDVEDISAFLASINLKGDERFAITNAEGDPKTGRKLYMAECKSCHKKTGYGKPKKGIPPLAGQQTDYIVETMKAFKGRTRVHDDDPTDDIFDDYSDADLTNMMAFVSSLDDKVEKRTASLPGAVKLASADISSGKGLQINDIFQTVAKIELREGVSREDAIDAMNSKATELNMRLVGEQHVSQAVAARGEKMPYLTIYQFCNLSDARSIILNNPIYAAYMPCRIALVEDTKGKNWLMMLNLDILIDNKLISKEVVRTVISVNQKMLEIMVAGVTGDF